MFGRRGRRCALARHSARGCVCGGADGKRRRNASLRFFVSVFLMTAGATPAASAGTLFSRSHSAHTPCAAAGACRAAWRRRRARARVLLFAARRRASMRATNALPLLLRSLLFAHVTAQQSSSAAAALAARREQEGAFSFFFVFVRTCVFVFVFVFCSPPASVALHVAPSNKTPHCLGLPGRRFAACRQKLRGASACAAARSAGTLCCAVLCSVGLLRFGAAFRAWRGCARRLAALGKAPASCWPVGTGSGGARS